MQIDNKKKRGALLVHEQLRNDILWLSVNPGSAIDEVTLAERFEVSRTPIREALLLLSGEGLVQFLPNRTTIVAPLSLNNIGEYFDTLLVLARSVGRSAAMKGRLEDNNINTLLSEAKAAAHCGDVATLLRKHLGLFKTMSASTENIFLDKYFCNALDSGIRTRLLHFFPNTSESELHDYVLQVEDGVNSVLSGNEQAGDDAMRDIFTFEANIILRSLKPQYGADMELTSLKVGN